MPFHDNPTAQQPLILASTSRYRRELLERLRLPFSIARPESDETALPDETPAALALRLAHAKAAAVAALHPDAWVIGSDQVAELGTATLGKPGNREAAVGQLAAMSGQPVRFRTGVCLYRQGVTPHLWLDTTTVRFRTLRGDEIGRYVDAEQPFDCAGSFKCEGLGISLFDAIETQDPTALIGLPLIATARLLREAGFSVP
ncbi:Maf family protein [Montanilutibacter psychrotolerans]|uniref:7-methyl-GTP pyrophosphatase n=1 Tax=Montanilutibacter psychrotolerans TaxID=1327343 RepID=A0A3M8T2G9_9GAMM|nr:Maf family nucleotide pyrophosphatase [Lysobacter psychrotolerans]RNF84952.1 septum formation inhibitor Maf [Lysobacter psychrotolerans]